MSHPFDDDIIPANDTQSPADEAAFYNLLFAMTPDDPQVAQSLLMEWNDARIRPPHFPEIRSAVIRGLKRRIEEMAAAAAAELPTGPDAPGGERDQAREASFRANPGWHLPGAEPAPVQQLRPDGFGYVMLDGLVYPWTYASRSYLVSDLHELITFAEREGYNRGVLVGVPELAADMEGLNFLPEGFLFAPIDMVFFDVGRTA